MSREIKFRAWSKEERKMYPCFGFMNGQVLIIKDNQAVGEKDEHFDLMQFTGLQDKYGKDIYENDLVMWDGDTYTVIFSTDEGTWILKDDREDWECPSLYGVKSPQQSRIWIVGNVYEPPAWLDEKL